VEGGVTGKGGGAAAGARDGALTAGEGTLSAAGR
jgi:hypothetical protein